MEHEKDILDLIYSSACRAAPYITHKLSTIGDGTMAEGIRSIAQYAAKAGIERGKKAGLRDGIILGAGGTFLIMFGANVAKKIRLEKIERTRVLEEAEHNIKVADTKAESLVDDDKKSDCEGTTDHAIEEKEN